MTLDLVAPIGSNFIKDWVSQNEANCDEIDDFSGPLTIQQYTPTLVAQGTAASIGAGISVGYYYRIFNFIYVWGEFRFGTGFVKGTGTYNIDLPFKMDTTIPLLASPGGSAILGNAYAWDDSAAARHHLIVQSHNGNSNNMFFQVRGGTAFSTRSAAGDDIPFVWAINDGITWNARYQRDIT